MNWYEALKEGIKDMYGNKLYISGGQILLKLIKIGEVRVIGRIENKDDVRSIYMAKSDRHIMKVNNSYGFNYELIKMLPKDIIIKIETPRHRYIGYTTVGDIIEKGTFLHFLSYGFEKQIFLPIENLHKNQQEKKW